MDSAAIGPGRRYSLADLYQTADGQPNENGLVSVAPDALYELLRTVEAADVYRRNAYAKKSHAVSGATSLDLHLSRFDFEEANDA